MTERLTDELETYRGRKYFMEIRADPGFNTPEDFAVVVYYRDAEASENRQIARVDTSHGFTHFDKVYRRDEPKEEVDGGLWEAVRQLQENWRTYAESFENK